MSPDGVVWRFLKASLFFFAAGLAACSQPASPTDGLVLDALMPELVLVDVDGVTAKLSDYRGKLVVLNLWATWCEPCRREMPNLQQLSNSLDPQRFVVVGVAADEDGHLVREYLLEKGIKFPNYIDKGMLVSQQQLGIQIFPYTLLIAPDGRLIQRFAGPREWQRETVIELLQRAFAGDYSDLR